MELAYPNMNPPRVTLGQIATRARVHVTTVSLALRDSHRLPLDTRERIQKLARQMGYAPDPVLSALNAYRSKVRAPVFQATLAYFNNYPERHQLLSVPTFREYHRGALRRAEELGYKLEEVWLHEPHLTPQGIRRRLLSKGIRGILVFPQSEPGMLPNFAWDDFSAVAFGYSVTSPQLHRVTNHQFRSVLHLIRELRYLGYRRIGLNVAEEYDRRMNLAPTAAYGAYDRSIPARERVPILVPRYRNDLHRLRGWIERHRPDAIICQDFSMWDKILSLGMRVPEDIGFAYIHIGKAETLLSGIHQNDEEIGRTAIDFLVAMLHRNERGVPAVAQHVLVDGVWLPRQSTRRVGEPAEWFLDRPLVPLIQNGPAFSPGVAVVKTTGKVRTRAVSVKL